MAKAPSTIIAYLAGGFTVLLTVILTFFSVTAPKKPAMPVRQMPSFVLEDQNGRSFSSEDLKGKIALVSFIYTRCQGPCPIVSRQLQQLQAEAFKNPDVFFLTLTLDPEHDTTPVLAEYAKKLGALDRRWLFLTGLKQPLRELISRGFLSTALDQNDPGNPIVHSTKFVLVDRGGFIRGFIEGGDAAQNPKILECLRQMQGEKP